MQEYERIIQSKGYSIKYSLQSSGNKYDVYVVDYKDKIICSACGFNSLEEALKKLVTYL